MRFSFCCSTFCLALYEFSLELSNFSIYVRFSLHIARHVKSAQSSDNSKKNSKLHTNHTQVELAAIPFEHLLRVISVLIAMRYRNALQQCSNRNSPSFPHLPKCRCLFCAVHISVEPVRVIAFIECCDLGNGGKTTTTVPSIVTLLTLIM